MKNDRLLVLKDVNGKDINAEILFTYFSKEFNKNYVIFQVEGSDEANAAVYVEIDETTGRLQPVETDAEWALLEQLLQEYFEENEEE